MLSVFALLIILNYGIILIIMIAMYPIYPQTGQPLSSRFKRSREDDDSPVYVYTQLATSYISSYDKHLGDSGSLFW
jgi:hypothetical protein